MVVPQSPLLASVEWLRVGPPLRPGELVMQRIASAFVLMLYLISPVRGDVARTHAITVDDYFTLATVSEIALSHDGKHVAYIEGRWDKKHNERRIAVWSIDVESGAARRLTEPRAGDHGLR